MAFTLQKTTGGNLLTTNSALAGECCCNPCDPDPSMLLSVSGSSGSITWCGETWDLPGDSGDVREVCPVDYFKQQYTATILGESNKIALNAWNHDSSLVLSRYYRYQYPPITQTEGHNYVVVRDGFTARSFHTTDGKISYTTLGIGLSAAPIPTYNEYAITDEYFGSYETGGITYTWSKGAGW